MIENSNFNCEKSLKLFLLLQHILKLFKFTFPTKCKCINKEKCQHYYILRWLGAQLISLMSYIKNNNFVLLCYSILALCFAIESLYAWNCLLFSFDTFCCFQLEKFSFRFITRHFATSRHKICVNQFYTLFASMQYARLNPDSTFAREEVLQAMLQCQGDEEGARQHLQNTLLQPFLQRVWQGMEEDELGGTVGVGRSLLQMAIAETCQSVSTSVISHEDFQQRVKDKTLDREVSCCLCFFSHWTQGMCL